jgi:hypothetical protein
MGMRRAGHAVEQDGGRFRHFHHDEAGLELLRQVALEARPVLGAGDDVLEPAHHLAAVAHPQGEAVGTFEEGLEFVARPLVVQDGRGPAAAGAEHVAVGEAAAGRQALEGLEFDAAGDDIAHVHVHRCEAGPGEGRRHLHLAVDALLAQDGHPGLGAFLLHIGGGHILIQVESEFGVQARDSSSPSVL